MKQHNCYHHNNDNNTNACWAANQHDFWRIVWHWRLKSQLCIMGININDTFLNRKLIMFHSIFDQINAALVSMNIKQILLTNLMWLYRTNLDELRNLWGWEGLKRHHYPIMISKPCDYLWHSRKKRLRPPFQKLVPTRGMYIHVSKRLAVVFTFNLLMNAP